MMLTSPSPTPSSSFFTIASSASSSSLVVPARLPRLPAPQPRHASSAPPTKRRRAPSPSSLHPGVKRPKPDGLRPPVLRRRAARSSSSSLGASSPEPIYRSSRSRSTSTFPSAEAPIPRECWIDDAGSPGQTFLSSEIVVKGLMRTYKAFFKNPYNPEDTSFEPHPTHYPVAELEYPNSDACERFILLAPKDKDHYNPIMCLERSLYTIIECYLSPKQQSLFGTTPTDMLSDVTTPPPSPSPSPPNSQTSTNSSLSSLSSLPSSTSTPAPRINYLRALQRAIHLQNGPLFLKTLDSINELLRALKYPPLPADPFDPSPSPTNVLRAAVRNWPAPPKQVLHRIVDECYQRSVGPHVHSLLRYSAFSSEVYGELMPSLAADILAATGLRPGSLFLDLGSGVGNVVLQAALQTGCYSFGIEVMPAPARIAREQLEQFCTRCRMWGVRMGDVELEEGDMLQSRRVSELMPRADVVLVNNKVFLESLNEALRPKFLDLKEGAIVVSLKPFVSSLNARVTERNVDDISAIFDVTERPYHSGSVSWGSGGGSYYLHRVDREGYASIRERFENSRAGSGRSSRSRR